MFEGSHKPLAVRCVKFRPIVTATEMGTEMLLASGDSGGNLRVWRLTAPKLVSSFFLNFAPPSSPTSVLNQWEKVTDNTGRF